MSMDKDKLGNDKAIIMDDITPKDMLWFAKLILMWVAIIFVLSWLADWAIPGHGIFDCCATTLPSIATLVIGYYFGKTN